MTENLDSNKPLAVGAQIREYRERLNLTLVDIAGYLGCTQAYVSNLERGVKPVPKTRLKELASYFEERGIDGAHETLTKCDDASVKVIDMSMLTHEERGVLGTIGRAFKTGNQAERTSLRQKLEIILKEMDEPACA